MVRITDKEAQEHTKEQIKQVLQKEESEKLIKQQEKEEMRRLFMQNAYSAVNVVEGMLNLGESLKSNTSTNSNSLKKALMNPSTMKNVKILQDAVASYKHRNGILRQFINYQSNILTNDFFLIPTDMNKFKSQEDMWKKEFEAAKYVELFNVKNNLRWMFEEVLTCGELYIYNLETKTSIIPLKIPSEICVITGKDEYLNNRFAIDLGKIKDDELAYYPKEIQDAFLKRKNNTLNPELLINKKYYQVSEKGVAFTLDPWGIKGVPYFAHLLEPLMRLDELEPIEVANAILDNVKLVHQLVPIDDKGNYLINYDDASMYHDALKSAVPDGIGAVTSPMKIDSVSLGDLKSKNMDYIEKSKKNIYDAAGFNDDLFNGSKSSNEAIAIGSTVDTLVPLKLQGIFGNWINTMMKRNSKTKVWKISFVDSTEYNKFKVIQRERENLAVYGSKKKYLAAQGFTPLEAMNIIKNEELLQIAEMMPPMQTSHTLSGKNGKVEDKGGRPSNENNPEENTETGESQNG